MEDAEYLFHSTSKEAKRIARGSFSKKGGMRSKKCTLPSDYMTNKQKKEMNSKVEHYNLTKPTDWKTFKSWPIDIQKGWLSYMANVNKGRLKDVAELLGVADNTLGVHMNQNPILKGTFSGRRKTVSVEWGAFLASCAEKPAEPPAAETAQEHVEEPKSAPARSSVVQQAVPDVDIRNGVISYSGKPAAIFEAAFRALNQNVEYHVTLRFSKLQKETVDVDPQIAPYRDLAEQLGLDDKEEEL